MLGVLIFVITYALISARRLSWLRMDRPAAALVGAIACVAVGTLTPRAALDAIDGHTLLLLFGVMGIGAFLTADGLFEELAARLSARATSPAQLLGWVVWGSGLLSALLTNDAVCVLGAPVVVQLVRRHRLPALPFLLALATGANTGSVATLVGNPQNMLCASLGGLSFSQHLLLLGPVAVIGLGIDHAVLLAFFRVDLRNARLTRADAPGPLGRGVLIDLAVVALTAIAYALGANLAFTAVGGFVVLILLRRRDTRELWSHIDGSLLVFFTGLFVVVGGLVATGAPEALFARFPVATQSADWREWWRLSATFLVGSNLVSNVPFILIVRDQVAASSNPRLAWEMLAMASTFAGNLTLLGSVANIIVIEAGRELRSVSFMDHLKVGLPIALLTTAMGTAWLLAAAHFGLVGI